MTPEQEALVRQVLDDAEMTRHILSQPQFAELWKFHSWGYVNRLDFQDTLPRDKRTSNGWPPEVRPEQISEYIERRVGELVPVKRVATTPPDPPPTDTHVERFRALLNEGEKA